MASESSTQQQPQPLKAASNVQFKCEDAKIAFNNSVALLSSKIPLYKNMLLFLSHCCISKALTIQPSAIYTEYLREFWYTAEVEDDTITFSLLHIVLTNLQSANGLHSQASGRREETRTLLIMEHLLGEAYVNDNLKPMKSYQITDASFKDSKIYEVPLTSYMRRVAKLPEQPLVLPYEEVNVEGTDDKSSSGTAVHPVSQPKAKTNKKLRKKKIPSSSEPKVSKTVRSLEASKSVEDQENQSQTVDTTKDQETIVKEAEHTKEKNDEEEFVDSGLQSMGDVALESLNEPADESPYDTESEIKFVKRFKPLVDDDEP
ncbi:hypothetical protein Tco_0721728 [Tanacetum coccineum]